MLRDPTLDERNGVRLEVLLAEEGADALPMDQVVWYADDLGPVQVEDRPVVDAVGERDRMQAIELRLAQVELALASYSDYIANHLKLVISWQ